MTIDEFVPNPAITKQVMQEYEKVRQSGRVDMFDLTGVLSTAASLKCEALVDLLVEDFTDQRKFHTRISNFLYAEILMNFGKYMKLYDMKQPWNGKHTIGCDVNVQVGSDHRHCTCPCHKQNKKKGAK